ncbi:MAG: diguanylate cyclase [Anaerolineales bacterium]|nr:diguanylate cyclase [Anaerolineales bacterium]
MIAYAHIFPSIDEFVAILPETDTTQAQVLIDWLKSAVTAKFVRERLGISVGIAVLQPGMTAQSLLAEADRSRYRAKPARA